MHVADRATAAVGCNSRPIAKTSTMLLHAGHAQAGIALGQNCGQALANCQLLMDTAPRLERSASSFRGFVEYIEADAERDELDEAPIIDEGIEGFRIMTVFEAKGTGVSDRDTWRSDMPQQQELASSEGGFAAIKGVTVLWGGRAMVAMALQ